MDHRGEGELRAGHQLTFRSSKSATAIVSTDRRVDAITADAAPVETISPVAASATE